MALTSESGAHAGTLSTTQNAAGGGTAYASDGFGPTLFVNTFSGQDYYTGLTPATPLATMAAAFEQLDDWNTGVAGSSSNARIYVLGDIREQVTAPLGVYGVHIIGGAGGNGRNTTSNGVELPGNGVQWREPATPTSSPLLTLREQGWVLENLFFYPGATCDSAVELRRQEDATYPDASHAQFINCKFFGAGALGTATGTGIHDYGGQYDVSVEGCWFQNLEYAIHNVGGSIATPLMWQIGMRAPVLFQLCKHDILVNASGWRIGTANFMTVYNVTTHPNTLNLASTGQGTYPNRVNNAIFADAIADVTIAKGYVKGNNADVWRYYASATAAYSVALPA